MKKRIILLFEAFIYYIIYLFSGIIGNIASVAVATVILGAEYMSNHMLADNTVFFEEVISFTRSEVALGIFLANIAVVVIYYFAFRNRKINLGTYIGMKRFKFFSAVAAVVAGIFAHGVVVNILELLNPAAELMQEYDSKMQWVGEGNVYLLLSVLLLVAPVVEEIVFRGVLVSSLQKVITPLGALFVTSLLFAFAHGNIIQFWYSFALGLLLAFIKIRSGSLWNCIFMHIAFNASNIFIVNSKMLFNVDCFGINLVTVIITVLFASMPFKRKVEEV